MKNITKKRRSGSGRNTRQSLIFLKEGQHADGSKEFQNVYRYENTKWKTRIGMDERAEEARD